MKEISTPEFRARLFAQYWGQIVFLWEYPKHCSIPNRITEVGSQLALYSGCGKLMLKAVSDITDEECKEYLISIAVDPRPHYIESAKKQFLDEYDDHYSLDWLRSKGYAVPYFGFTVEHLVSEGLVEIVKPQS